LQYVIQGLQVPEVTRIRNNSFDRMILGQKILGVLQISFRQFMVNNGIERLYALAFQQELYGFVIILDAFLL
jgi:hypothetical protein